MPVLVSISSFLLSSTSLYIPVCVADVVIRERLKDVEKVENESVKLQCKVKNPKNYPVSWLKDGTVLQQDDRWVSKFSFSIPVRSVAKLSSK